MMRKVKMNNELILWIIIFGFAISPIVIVFLCHLLSMKFDKSSHSLYYQPRIFPIINEK